MLKFPIKKITKIKKITAKFKFLSTLTSKKETGQKTLNYTDLVNNFESKIKNK